MKNKRNLLILKSDKDSFEKDVIKAFRCNGFNCEPVYKYNNKIINGIMAIWIKYLHLPMKSIWYGNWKRNIKKYNTFIIFDRILSWDIIKYISKENSDARIILWYWNPVMNAIGLPKKNRNLEIWSFDERDCDRYGLRKNTQFFVGDDSVWNITNDTSDCKKKALFIGIDKGRYPILKKIAMELRKNGFLLDFEIVVDHTSKLPSSEFYINSIIDYGKVLDKINESSVIVDVPQSGQVGITQRVLESQFYRRKLITTMQNIDEFPFYHPDNIFIFGKDSDLNSFLKRRCNQEYFSYAKYYSIEQWCSRFDAKND